MFNLTFSQFLLQQKYSGQGDSMIDLRPLVYSSDSNWNDARNPGRGSMRTRNISTQEKKIRSFDPRKNRRNESFPFPSFYRNEKHRPRRKEGRGTLDLTNARLIDHRLRYVVPCRTNKPSSSGKGGGWDKRPRSSRRRRLSRLRSDDSFYRDYPRNRLIASRR